MICVSKLEHNYKKKKNMKKKIKTQELNEQKSKEILERVFPNYLEFVELTKSNRYLTYIDKGLMLSDFIHHYDYITYLGIEKEDEYFELSIFINYIFELLCDIYKLKFIVSKKKRLKKRKSIYTKLKVLRMTVILDSPIDKWLDENVITDESKYLNMLISTMGYTIPTTDELVEFRNSDNGLSEEELDKLINRH